MCQEEQPRAFHVLPVDTDLRERSPVSAQAPVTLDDTPRHRQPPARQQQTVSCATLEDTDLRERSPVSVQAPVTLDGTPRHLQPLARQHQTVSLATLAPSRMRYRTPGRHPARRAPPASRLLRLPTRAPSATRSRFPSRALSTAQRARQRRSQCLGRRHSTDACARTRVSTATLST